MTKQKKQLLVWRILLGILIVCNMAMVFLFSSQNATQSAAISEKVAAGVVEMLPLKPTEKQEKKEDKEVTTTRPKKNNSNSSNKKPSVEPSQEETAAPSVEETAPVVMTPEVTAPVVTPEVTAPVDDTNYKDSAEKLTAEQFALLQKMHTPIRKLAHMLEFGLLATLCFLFLLTWRGKLLWRYAVALGVALVYAAVDEFHQLFRDGRGGLLSDVLIDFLGAFIACTVALGIVVLIRQIKKSKNTDSNPKTKKDAFFARVAQIFSQLSEHVLNQISKIKNIHLNKEKEN